MTLEEMIDEAEPGVVILEPREVYDKGLIGITDDRQHLVYSYDRLAEALAEEYKKDEFEDAYTAAQEWLDFNTIRSLPYMGDLAPIIIQELEV